MKIVISFLLCLSTASITAQDISQFLRQGSIVPFQGSRRIPIEIFNDLILLKVRVQGVEGTFVWDNGFSVTGLDSAFAVKAGLVERNGSIAMIDGNNQRTSADRMVAKEIDIQGIKANGTPVVIFKIPETIQPRKRPFDGFLGSSVINRLNWNFNFDNGYVDVSLDPFNSEGIKIPFAITGRNIHVMEGNINRTRQWIEIDFGSNNDVIYLNRARRSLFGNNNFRLVYGVSTFALAGMPPMDTSFVLRGTYDFTFGKDKIVPAPGIVLTSTEEEGRLGNVFFRRYNLVINCTPKKPAYVLRPRTLKPEMPAADVFRFKIMLHEGRLLVGKMEEVQDNAGCPITLLDEVESINGKTADDFADNLELIEYQNNLLKSSLEMELKMKNGTICRLKGAR